MRTKANEKRKAPFLGAGAMPRWLIGQRSTGKLLRLLAFPWHASHAASHCTSGSEDSCALAYLLEHDAGLGDGLVAEGHVHLQALCTAQDCVRQRGHSGRGALQGLEGFEGQLHAAEGIVVVLHPAQLPRLGFGVHVAQNALPGFLHNYNLTLLCASVRS